MSSGDADIDALIAELDDLLESQPTAKPTAKPTASAAAARRGAGRRLGHEPRDGAAEGRRLRPALALPVVADRADREQRGHQCPATAQAPRPVPNAKLQPACATMYVACVALSSSLTRRAKSPPVGRAQLFEEVRAFREAVEETLQEAEVS